MSESSRTAHQQEKGAKGYVTHRMPQKIATLAHGVAALLSTRPTQSLRAWKREEGEASSHWPQSIIHLELVQGPTLGHGMGQGHDTDYPN